MERLARAVIPGLPHPVVPQGNRRSAIFFEDGDPETYLDLPRVRVAKPEVAAGADCLMRYRATKYSYGLQYTPTGNIYTAADSVNSSWTCTYDPLNRLTKAAGTSETVGWNYDSLSDRTAQTALVGTPPTSTLTFNASNNRADQLCYDTAGNVLDEVPCSQATVPSFAYDTDGKLISASNGIVKYIYDADGMRVAKQSNGSRTNEYLYDVAGNMAVEINGSASVIRQELYGGGRHLATVSGGGAGPFEYTHTNWLGTEAARSDSTGNLCFTAVSLPYGDGLTYSGNCNVSAKFFTGKERDAESGLDYFGARYYGSNMERFMSPDWSPKPLPVPFADLGNPQSLNLYAYAGNNPLSRRDDDGHLWEELGNWFKWGHYVNNAGLENALKSDADAARKNLSGYKNMLFDGKTPQDVAANGSNKEAVLADRAATNFLTGVMITNAGNPCANSPGVSCGAVVPTGAIADYATEETVMSSAYFQSEGEARAFARTKLGSDIVEVSPGKWRSADGRWQFRAKPGDVSDNHVHLELINPQSGEVIQNLHLRWPEGTSR